MTECNGRNFSPKFCLETAQLVLDQLYTVAAASSAWKQVADVSSFR